MSEKKRRVELVIEPITKSLKEKKKENPPFKKEEDGIPENLYDDVSDGSDDERKIPSTIEIQEEVSIDVKKGKKTVPKKITKKSKNVKEAENIPIPPQPLTKPITKNDVKDEKAIVEQVREIKESPKPEISPTIESEVSFYREMIKQLISKPQPDIKIKPIIKKEIKESKDIEPKKQNQNQIQNRQPVIQPPKKPDNPFLAFF